mmetsp:Transcript_3999/g.7275  ORF Transcript_3999/g.7275 Transcript_3999/m.7275 type:complete len:152 (-) Transcript_3999:210-665(-)
MSHLCIYRFARPLSTSTLRACAASFSTAAKPKRRTLDSRERPAPITVTENAATRIKEMLAAKENAIGVKVGVKRRGCNGYSYTMDYALQTEDLKKFEQVKSHDVKVFVDPPAIFYILGTEMDYAETALSAEFTFVNPNSKGECGCGESFNV